MAKFIEVNCYNNGHNWNMFINLDWIDEITEGQNGSAWISFSSPLVDGERKEVIANMPYRKLIDMIKKENN